MADISGRGRMLIDLQQCAHLVQEAIYSKGLDSYSAARWLRQQRLNPIGQVSGEREPYSDVEASAVNVVTVHRSKGLEYRVVICPYLWQPPPPVNGPIWRLDKSEEWIIALNSKWGKGSELSKESQEASLQESERLCYVALTRAKDQLTVIWATGSKQEGNPLTFLLFGPKAMSSKSEELTIDRMNQWVTSNKIGISIHPVQTDKINGLWRPQQATGELSLGPSPQQKILLKWGRSSYSSLVNSTLNDYNQSLDPRLVGEWEDLDQQNITDLISPSSVTADQDSNNQWSNQGPFSKFPRGAAAGECLHRILERISFSKPLDNPATMVKIEEELIRAGFDISLTPIIQEGFTRVLSTPLGGPLGKLKLNQVNRKRRIHELSFDMPIAQNGNQIRSIDLVNAFLKDPKARFCANYNEKLATLNISSRGFLT